MGKNIVITKLQMDELDSMLSLITKQNRVYGLKYLIGNPTRQELQNLRFLGSTNANEQVIQLAGVIPPYARILDAFMYTIDQWTGAVSLGVKLGNATGGEQIIVSTNMYAMAAKVSMAANKAYTVAISDVASDLFISVTPGANWNLVTGGSTLVYVTYIDLFQL